MGVIALQENFDRVESGEIRALELIGLRYTGQHDSIATRGALASQGRWPGTAPLNKGYWYFALVPDEGLPYLENRDDLELVYGDDRERFAEALLSKNRLPDNVFGRSADPRLRSEVEDALDLGDPRDAGRYRDQLQELAGLDDDEVAATEADDADDRAGTLTTEHGRSELKAAVKEIREDADEFSLRGAEVTEMAEYLAEQDDADVNDALNGATGGDD